MVMPPQRRCLEEGCDRQHYARGLCHPHYDAYRARGRAPPLPPVSRVGRPLAVRFWEDVVKAPGDGCWVFTRGTSRHPHGYGSLSVNRRETLAHRVSWELAHGPIPPGLRVLHKCDNPPCVRPDHLFLGTQLDNVRDMWSKGRAKRRARKPRPPPKGVPRGSRHRNAKVAEADVRAMREARAAGERLRAIGERFGLSESNVCRIVSGETWRHVSAADPLAP